MSLNYFDAQILSDYDFFRQLMGAPNVSQTGSILTAYDHIDTHIPMPQAGPSSESHVPIIEARGSDMDAEGDDDLYA